MIAVRRPGGDLDPAPGGQDPVAVVADGLDLTEARLALSLLLACPGPDVQRRSIADRLDQPGDIDIGDVLDGCARARRAALPAPADVDALAARLADLGARLRLPGRAGYPPKLAQAWPELGAPAWLLVSGSVPAALAAPAVAIVGTRSPTLAGLRTAEEAARRLAGSGATVVSGLARGIDTAAHRGALRAGGATVGVLGAGLGVDYPRGSHALRQAVADAGALVGELPPDAEPRAHQFLWRNRIVAGLVDAVVVVEGRARSGALHTARMAVSQGREVWAAPGSLTSPTSAAPLALIRDGARVLTDLDELVAAVAAGATTSSLGGTGAATAPLFDPRWRDVDADARTVAALLGAEPAQPSDLARAAGLGVPTVLAAIAALVAAGLAHHGPRGVVADPDAGPPPAVPEV